MPRFAANLTWLFTELPLPERFAAAAAAGFRAVEILDPYAHPALEIAARCTAAGLAMVLVNAPAGEAAKGERGLAGLPGREADFDASIERAISYAEAFHCTQLHVMAGLLHHGATRATYVANLKRAAARVTKVGMTIVIEPINRRDVPGYFLNTLDEARSVIHEVAAANLGLQFDLYHRQMVAGDVVAAIREFASITRHMQLANPPDRGEPDAGELDYRYLFDVIDRSGFKGHIGCEYKPRTTTVAGLAWAERLGVKLG